MFSCILTALLALAVANPVAVLAQSNNTDLVNFAHSIAIVNDLSFLANETNIAADFKCIALVAADAVAVTAVAVAKGTKLCPAAAISCGLANIACTAAGCQGCAPCPSC